MKFMFFFSIKYCYSGILLKNHKLQAIQTHAAFVGSTPTEVEIFIWIMSPLWSKKTSVAATDERNIIILHRKIVNIRTHIRSVLQRLALLYMLLEHPFLGMPRWCNG